MGAIVLDGAVVKKHAFIGAGALVPPGRTVGEGELWVGNPARKMRVLSDAEIEGLHYSAGHYVRLQEEYPAAVTPEALDGIFAATASRYSKTGDRFRDQRGTEELTGGTTLVAGAVAYKSEHS